MADQEIRKIVVGFLITFAIGGNGFFIKRLVDKIDRIDDIERRIVLMQGDIALIKMRLGFASNEVFGPNVQSKTEGG